MASDENSKSQTTYRLGVLASSGGAALIAANNCLEAAGKKVDWVIVTDRECGLEEWGKKNRHITRRLLYRNPYEFSVEANAFFGDQNCENVILFFTRRIESSLFEARRVLNIHPSLLPAFPGLHSVKSAMAAGVKIFGATLHYVDNGLDTGKIVSQTALAAWDGIGLMELNYLSYLQKVWLTLAWFDRLQCSRSQQMTVITISPTIYMLAPKLSDENLQESYLDWLLLEMASKELQ